MLCIHSHGFPTAYVVNTRLMSFSRCESKVAVWICICHISQRTSTHLKLNLDQTELLILPGPCDLASGLTQDASCLSPFLLVLLHLSFNLCSTSMHRPCWSSSYPSSPTLHHSSAAIIYWWLLESWFKSLVLAYRAVKGAAHPPSRSRSNHTPQPVHYAQPLPHYKEPPHQWGSLLPTDIMRAETTVWKHIFSNGILAHSINLFLHYIRTLLYI